MDTFARIAKSVAVKRLSNERRRAQIMWQRRELRKLKNRSSPAVNHGLTAAAKQFFAGSRNRLPPMIVDLAKHKDRVTFVPPTNFSLVHNYEQTLGFIMDFKKLFAERGRHLCDDGVRRWAYADFASIEQIDAGAGLVLAAEVHRYAQVRGKPKEIHDHLWRENVRDFFVDSGLFELLNVDPSVIKTSAPLQPNRQTLQFTCGSAAQGEDARSLIKRLRELAGADVGPRPTVYTAVAEALANVRHAYPRWFRTWPYRTARQWWASGFWEESTKTVGIQLYDQGAGIPVTLPKQTHYPRIFKFLDPERTPSGLIKAALQYGRTSTDAPGRGRGLAEMADWIEKTGSGFLRIVSSGGEITYRPQGKISGRNFDAPFCGTLVEWQVQIG